MKPFKVTEFDNLLYYNRDFSEQDIRKIIVSNHLSGLRIFTGAGTEWTPDGLEFLMNLNFIEKLNVTSMSKDYNYSVINRLNFLKGLQLNIALIQDKTFRLDLTSFHQLESLSISARELKGDFGINHLSLKKLILVEFLKRNDLSLIRDMSTLEFFRVATGSIKTLDGLQRNKNLKELNLGACRSLTSIQAINGFNQLEIITIDGCSKISDYDSLTNLDGLKTLRIMDSKIPSIKFINNFPNIEEVILTGNTDILDGDLSPLSRINKVVCRPRKHYSGY